MQSPILVLRHEPFEHLGYFDEILRSHGIPFIYKDLDDPLPDQPAPLIVMGGPQSANDPLPGLKAELILIERAVTAGLPVLGICLGAQLIAKALGARVYKNDHIEIGWFPVYLTEHAKNDPLFGGLPSPAPFFHWHGETFDPPAGSTWLAYTEKCRHQAFRYGKNVYGIQFHPEITPAMIEDWCGQPVNCGDVASFDKPIDAVAFDTTTQSRHLLERWIPFLDGNCHS